MNWMALKEAVTSTITLIVLIGLIIVGVNLIMTPDYKDYPVLKHIAGWALAFVYLVGVFYAVEVLK